MTVVIGIMSLFVQYGGVSFSDYDIERRADIDALSRQVEAFYAENGGYPMAVSPLTLEFVDIDSFEDPRGRAIHNKPSTESADTARQVAENHRGPGDYVYVAYGRDGCRADCLGFFIKSKVSSVESETSYIRSGLRNQ